MKKSIAALVLSVAAASNVQAFPGPNNGNQPAPVYKTFCLNTYASQDGSLNADDCDRTEVNRIQNRRILRNGCAEDQISITTSEVEIKSCPAYTQL